jgi:DNA-binding NtrC family response regulator
MATESITRGVLLVASEEIGKSATDTLTGQGNLRVSAVTGPRAALAAVAQLTPHFLVFEAGRVPAPAMQAVKNMAELTASRPVPVIMICGPVEESIGNLTDSLGIAEVLDAPFDGSALLETLQRLIEKMEQARKESQLRRQKQQQIRERLRSASDKYAAMSAEAAAMRLQQPEPEVQDFASDDAAPPAEPDPNKPPDEPTWDGS